MILTLRYLMVIRFQVNLSSCNSIICLAVYARRGGGGRVKGWQFNRNLTGFCVECASSQTSYALQHRCYCRILL